MTTWTACVRVIKAETELEGCRESQTSLLISIACVLYLANVEFGKQQKGIALVFSWTMNINNNCFRHCCDFQYTLASCRF